MSHKRKRKSLESCPWIFHENSGRHEKGKFSSDTWRTGGWGKGEQSSSRVRLGAPEMAARGSGGTAAGASPPRWGDPTPAPRAIPSVHSCPCCKHRNEEPASEFTVICLKVLLEKLFLLHSSIFR